MPAARRGRRRRRVGATLNVTFAKNTTAAYIDNNAEVSAGKDVLVEASSEKFVNSAAIAGAGGGAAGVAGAVSVIAVGSLLDGEAKSGLGNGDAASYADGQTTRARSATSSAIRRRQAKRAACSMPRRTRWRLAVTWTTARPTFR